MKELCLFLTRILDTKKLGEKEVLKIAVLFIQLVVIPIFSHIDIF